VKIFNESQELRVAYMPSALRPRKPSLTVIAKGTWKLRPDAPPAPAEEPLYPSGDVRWDDDPERSLRYPSDFAPWKPRADILCVGRCHVPGGRPLPACRVELRVGKWKKALAVIGDRTWRGGLEPMTAPVPFRELELQWERAFGGGKERRNPVGRGAEASPGAPLPNLELPAALIQKPGDRPPPAGLGPLDMMWHDRFARVGTYDGAWLKERWPGFPRDFDYGFFNAAPADQQVEFLRGDEPLYLQNLHPAQADYRAQLPGVRARVFVRRVKARELQEIPTRLDTLWIDTESETLVLVWRGLCELQGDELDEEVGELLFALEPLAAELPVAEYAQKLLRRLGEEAAEGEAEPPPVEVVAGPPEPALAPAPPEAAPAPPALLEAEAAATAAALDQLLAQLGIDPATQAPVPERAALPQLDRKQLAELGLLDVMAEAEQAAQEPPPAELPPPEPAPPPAEPAPPGRDWFLARWQRGEHFCDEDLSGLDLSGLDLRGIDLRGAILTGARLDGTRLEGARLDRATAPGARLVEACLHKASLSEADLTGAVLSRADLSAADLSDAALSEARLDGARLEGARAPRALLARADLSNALARACELAGADLTGARLDRADFTQARMADVVLEQAAGERVEFAGADLRGARATEAALAGAHFREIKGARSLWTRARLERADFRFADLERADFTRAQLEGAHLGAANLKSGCLARASLRGTVLAGANCFRASFEKADLRKANCQGASCFEAEFLAAQTEGADFRGANLLRTKLG